nr:hypothetical protein B0A51_06478 [Rachicladosporium sp. CCFEE 5018]
MVAANPITRRSTRGKVKLSNDIAEVVSAAQLAVLEEHAAEAQNGPPAHSSFRVDLTRRQRFNIAAVSKQLYAETLPIFFAETDWELSIRSNIKVSRTSVVKIMRWGFARKSAPISFHGQMFRSTERTFRGKTAGKVLISHRTGDWLHGLGPTVDCIRKIRFYVYPGDDTEYKGVTDAFCKVSVRKNAGKYLASVEMSAARFEKLVTEPDLKDVIEQLQDMVNVAEARPEFRGFSFEDVESFASVFNHSA